METSLDDLKKPLNPVNSSEGNRTTEIVEVESSRINEMEGQDVALCRLKIRGMTGSTSANSVENAIKMIDGVKQAVISLAIEEAKVHFDTNLINEQQILEAVENAGFEVELLTPAAESKIMHIKIHGVDFYDMVIISRSLENAVGVNSVETDFSQQKLDVSYDPNQTGARSVVQCIQDAGQGIKAYSASLYVPPKKKDIDQLQEIYTYRNLSLWSFLFSVPVVLFSMRLPPYGEWLDYRVYNLLTVGMLLKWIFCTPVQFVVGRRLYGGSYYALRHRSVNIYVRIVLATSAAYFYSVYIVMNSCIRTSPFKGHDFFDMSCMVISFMIFGKYLEARVKRKLSNDLARLAVVAPDTTCLVTVDDDGTILLGTEIDTQLLQRNDVIKISPGAIVPADGIIIQGHSHVNESIFTRESMSILKAPGDKVIGGTVNESGTLIAKVTHVGVDTMLSQIIQLVESAQLSLVPAQKFTHKVSIVFGYLVVMLAFLTWLLWLIFVVDGFELALQFAIMVLVVTVPFAFDLATETTVLIASKMAASLGVFLKGENAIKYGYKVDTVVFDKIGTLTLGPEVVNVVLFNNFSMVMLCDMAVAVESNNKHPLGKAIVEHAKKMQERFGGAHGRRPSRRMEKFEVFSGGGVGGKVDNKLVLVGSRTLMCDHNVIVDSEVDQYIRENKNLAQTYILVAINGIIAGAFGVSDPPKPEAKATLTYLHSKNISTLMVADDDDDTAIIIANELCIDKVVHDTDPIGKANMINGLKAAGNIVAMVGDGVKDAPALAVADVGIAIGAGVDMAIEAADIVLRRNNLKDVATAIHISRLAVGWIWLNYMWVICYNSITVLVSTGVLYPLFSYKLPLYPGIAGGCMVLSSLFYCLILFLAPFYKTIFAPCV